MGGTNLKVGSGNNTGPANAGANSINAETPGHAGDAASAAKLDNSAHPHPPGNPVQAQGPKENPGRGGDAANSLTAHQQLEFSMQEQTARLQTNQPRPTQQPVPVSQETIRNSPSQITGQPHGHAYGHDNFDAGPARGGAQAYAASTASAVEYLRGGANAQELPPGLAKALGVVSDALGRDYLNGLFAGGARDAEELLGHVVARAMHALERGGAQEAGPHQVQQTVEELFGALKLDRYFKGLEQVGEQTVRRAEQMAWRVLNGEAGRNGPERLNAAELLRDLRSGAFFPAHELDNPFPLTGRARVASEMIELMRTLDAIDRFAKQTGRMSAGGDARQALSGGGRGDNAAAHSGSGLDERLIEELLSLLPLPPGRAGRLEIARIIGSMNGPLTDRQGKPLLAPDGLPIRLGQLLWLGAAGGLPGAATELLGTHPSALLLYGFDALYPLIGFDGRTLSPPRFVAVQAQVNGSEPEWIFGQPPLSEGWLRALIEHLKDSAAAEVNRLGEMLEEALADGRFYTALACGAVSEGQPVRQSFSFLKLLPEAAAESPLAYT